MYSWIWRKLPGGRLMKVVEIAVLLAAIALFMFAIGFPALEHLIGIDSPAVTD